MFINSRLCTQKSLILKNVQTHPEISDTSRAKKYRLSDFPFDVVFDLSSAGFDRCCHFSESRGSALLTNNLALTVTFHSYAGCLCNRDCRKTIRPDQPITEDRAENITNTQPQEVVFCIVIWVTSYGDNLLFVRQMRSQTVSERVVFPPGCRLLRGFLL